MVKKRWFHGKKKKHGKTPLFDGQEWAKIAPKNSDGTKSRVLKIPTHFDETIYRKPGVDFPDQRPQPSPTPARRAIARDAVEVFSRRCLAVELWSTGAWELHVWLSLQGGAPVR